MMSEPPYVKTPCGRHPSQNLPCGQRPPVALAKGGGEGGI